MSSTINCYVDTNPMAETVGKVSNHVDGTTTAVVAMKAAVVAAETEGANHVCKQVNRGFYTLIRSQISQKLAKLKSDVDSHLLRLNQQRKQLIAIRQRMERDYNMISSRYIKTFTTINRNLEQRVAELDRPILNLAQNEADKVTNRASRLTADIPVGQLESVKTSQMIAASNLKFRALKSIESIDRFIADSNELEDKTSQILLRRRMGEGTESASWTIPVAIMESNYDASDMSQTRMFVSMVEMPQNARRDIENTFDQAIRGNYMPWSEQVSIPAEVANEFFALMSASGLPQRCQQKMAELFQNHPFQTL